MSLALLYLSRKKNSGIENLEKFIRSYKKICHGYDHQLYVLLKGYNLKEIDSISVELKSLKAKKIILEDLNYDLGSYFYASKQINEKFVCFLNTESKLIIDNWLYIMMKQINTKNISMIGTTASFETHAFRLPYFDLSVSGFFYFFGRVLFRFINRFYNNFYFKKFPNPHIRTNGFIVNRKIF